MKDYGVAGADELERRDRVGRRAGAKQSAMMRSKALAGLFADGVLNLAVGALACAHVWFEVVDARAAADADDRVCWTTALFESLLEPATPPGNCVLAAFVVVLMCLFPLAPIWMKKIVLYTCISILGVFFFIFVVRTAVFAVVWLLTGRHFWILPNITSDEIPIDEVFSPMWEFDDLDASGNVVGRINAVKRLGLAGALTAVLVGLYKIAPENTKAINIHKAHDSILDLFDLNDVPKGIAGSTASGAKLDPQDPANIARMDKMRREAGGAGSRVTVEDVDGLNGTSMENGENATEPLEPCDAMPPDPDKPM